MSEYPFVAGRLIHHTKNSAILAPIQEIIDQATYWRVYLGDWHFWIKLDTDRPTPKVFRDLEAKPGSPLVVLCRDLRGSPEHNAVRATAALRKKRQS